MIKAKIKEWRDWLQDFWFNNYEEILTGVIVFLLVGFAFGVGFLLGSGFYQDSQININCPPSFWEKNE